MANVERAILSVSDKTGIIDLARVLHARGVEILSTGGTAKHLSDAGIPVTAISQWSGAPAVTARARERAPSLDGFIDLGHGLLKLVGEPLRVLGLR